MFTDRSVAMERLLILWRYRLTNHFQKALQKAPASRIDMNRAGGIRSDGRDRAKEYRGCTSHFSVMDKYGNVFVQADDPATGGAAE